ncbi:penicillin binding protein transpeptidase domain-containing protein [Leptospira langatensis]|uniref:Penicillin binding protein transpeptidase domain-containing protein n=1 Tax=Leptospira langatensis TaxID=2484983 RepID=A0A5F1ZX85_9LEPT|nr:penicillin binding protein transpeptidase domain-containing protein [Leptospira langatensis]TGL42197.1 penicillin binding protein transpeptidase domain-containing protein [Leptospira langatensis]
MSREKFSSLLSFLFTFAFLILDPDPIFTETIPSRPNELILITRFSKQEKKEPETLAIGSLEFRKQTFSPASTFKIYLTLSLLENHIVSLDEKQKCADKHIPNSPRDLDLREALFYSSNEYFEKVFSELGKEKLDRTLLRIGYIPKTKKGKAEPWWIDLDGLKHGGRIRLKPDEIHSHWVRIFGDGYSYPKEIVSDWKKSLFWSECKERAANVYGKTGSWEKSFWFQGALVQGENDYVIYTVLDRDPAASRTRTIQRFYELVGCTVPSLE